MIGGNTEAKIQVKDYLGKNAIGEMETDWIDAVYLTGFLDRLQVAGSTVLYNSYIDTGNFIFICDFFNFHNVSTQWLWDPFRFLDGLAKSGTQESASLTGDNCRMVIGGQVYHVKAIDNPMLLNQHLEIELEYVGGL